MRVETMGTDFSHKPNEFSPRIIRKNIYSICFFDTDFVYEYNGTLINGNSGDFLINEPNQVLYHGPRKNAKQGYINDWMHISGKEISNLFKKYPLPINKPFKIKNIAMVKKLFKRIENEFLTKNEGYGDIIKSNITLLIINVFREYSLNLNTPGNNEEIEKIHTLICKEPNKNWKLKELAALSGYSVSRFCEIYKQLYNESPINTLNSQKILYAKNLLLSGQVNVGQTAEMCGYNNIYYFSKYFKKVTGHSPSYYINKEIWFKKKDPFNRTGLIS